MVSSSKKYLKKGQRTRQYIQKKLDIGGNNDNQLVYIKEYDQWIPKNAVENNPESLKSMLAMLKGD